MEITIRISDCSATRQRGTIAKIKKLLAEEHLLIEKVEQQLHSPKSERFIYLKMEAKNANT